MPEEKRDWKKIVNDSKGSRIFLPDQFKERAEEWSKKRMELLEYLRAAAEKELRTNMLSQNILFNFREYLDKNGFKDNWSKEIGWDVEALKEDIFIINLIDPIPLSENK